VLKKHVERCFSAGKRDPYAAFILKCLKLAAPATGRVGMLTPQSWMFLPSFADLRALDDEKLKKMPRAFGGILRDRTIETVAHLGEHTFDDASAAGRSSPCLSFLRRNRRQIIGSRRFGGKLGREGCAAARRDRFAQPRQCSGRSRSHSGGLVGRTDGYRDSERGLG
jgi:hypothetical protein